MPVHHQDDMGVLVLSELHEALDLFAFCSYKNFDTSITSSSSSSSSSLSSTTQAKQDSSLKEDSVNGGNPITDLFNDVV